MRLTVSECESRGKDFVGIVTFDELADAVMAGHRFEILAVHRCRSVTDRDACWQVILKARF